MIWTAEADAIVEQMAPDHTAAQIAKRLGTTRNAVLGRSFRRGLSLYHPNKSATPEQMAERGRLGSSGRKGKTLPVGHPSLHSRTKGSSAFSLRQRAGAVAALMAGSGYRLAAEIAGGSKVTLYKIWRFDPVVRAEAERIYAAAHADASARLAERRRMLDLQHNAAMAHNRRLLSEWGERNRSIVLRRCAGETLAAIGGDYGVTRERVRQICDRAIAQGLIAPPGINLRNDRSFVGA